MNDFIHNHSVYYRFPTSVSSGQSPLRTSLSLTFSLAGQFSTRATRWSMCGESERWRPSVENQSPNETKSCSGDWNQSWGRRASKQDVRASGMKWACALDTGYMQGSDEVNTNNHISYCQKKGITNIKRDKIVLNSVLLIWNQVSVNYWFSNIKIEIEINIYIFLCGIIYTYP